MFSSKFCGSKVIDLSSKVGTMLCLHLTEDDSEETIVGYDDIIRRFLAHVECGKPNTKQTVIFFVESSKNLVNEQKNIITACVKNCMFDCSKVNVEVCETILEMTIFHYFCGYFSGFHSTIRSQCGSHFC